MGMIVELVPNRNSGSTINTKNDGKREISSHPLQGFSLRWYNFPINTQCFAVIVDDPHQISDPIHYLGYDIPVGNEAIDNLEMLGNQVAFDLNHPLRIRVYALKSRTNLPPEASHEQLRRAMEGLIVAVGQQWLSLQVH